MFVLVRGDQVGLGPKTTLPLTTRLKLKGLGNNTLTSAIGYMSFLGVFQEVLLHSIPDGLQAVFVII